MENIGEAQDSFVTSTNESDDCKAAVSELSYLIASLNTDEQQQRKIDSTPSFKTNRKKVDEPLPWYPNYVRLSLSIIGTNNLKALQNVISFFHHNISRDVKDAYMKPNRAAKVKVLLFEALMYFNTCFSEVKLPLDQDTYLDQMTDLVAMYIDMELKASRRGKESTKKVSSKLSSSLCTFLNSSVDHILDSVLKSRFMIKSFSEICIPVLKKILKSPFHQMYEMTYVRYVLTFKLWKRISTDQEEKKKIISIASTIVPPPRLEEMLQDGLLHHVLPPLRKNKKKLPLTLFFITTKVNLKETIKEFMKIYRNTKHNGIAAAFDKSRFFKEHRNETTGDDMKDASTELIDSIWTSFSNSSVVAQESYSKPSTLCSNKNEIPKKKAKSTKSKKQKKTKNGKLTKKKKKKIKLVKTKNNSKSLSVKDINKNIKDILPMIDTLKEKHLLDIMIENKESTDIKEDVFMKNLLNVMSAFKGDVSEGNENNSVNSDSSIFECEIIDTRNKVEGSKEDNYISNNEARVETVVYDNNIRHCKISNKSEKDVTSIQKYFDKSTSSKFASLEMGLNFNSLGNNDVIKSADSSSKCLQIAREIMNFHVNLECSESNTETKVKERNITNKENVDIDKICNYLPNEIQNMVDKEINNKASDEQLIQKNDNSKHSEKKISSIEFSNNGVNFCDRTSSDIMKIHEKLNFNRRVLDVTYKDTDIGMEVSRRPDSKMTHMESNKEISDSMPNDELSRQQKYTVSNKQVLSCKSLSKTSDRLIESSERKDMEGNIENRLAYSLKALHIEECVLDTSLDNSVNVEKISNIKNNLLLDSKNTKNEIFQPRNKYMCTESYLDRSDTDLKKKISKSTAELSLSLLDSVNKTSHNMFERAQGLSNKTNQVASKSFNNRHNSKLVSVKLGTEKLINETLETSSEHTNPVVNHSENICASKECGERNGNTQGNKDINNTSSFKDNKIVVMYNGLSSEVSDIAASGHSNMCRSENACFNTFLSSHKGLPIVSTNCSQHTEQKNIEIKDLLLSANCDTSINKNLIQMEEEITVPTTDTVSKNNKIILDTNTLTSKGQGPLKVNNKKEDMYPCPKSFEEILPLTNLGIEHSGTSPDISYITATEREPYELGLCNIKRVDNLPVLEIKEKKIDFLSTIRIPVSSYIENTLVTGCSKQDMKPDVFSIHNMAIVDINSGNKPIKNSNMSHFLKQMGIEKNTYMKKTSKLDNKQTCTRKEDSDKSVILNSKQITSTTDVNCKHVINDTKNKCNMQVIPLPVYDERESVQKTIVYSKNNIYNMKTTPKENVDSCAKVFSNVSSNKIIEATDIENISANILQEKNLDISRLEDKTVFNKVTYNINEKLVDSSANRHQLISLQEEEKVKNLIKCDSSTKLALNTSYITNKDKSKATVKTNISCVVLKKQNAESDQVILGNKLYETKLNSLLMSSKAEGKHTLQKEGFINHTSSTDASILSQTKVTSNSNHVVPSHTAGINIIAKKNKSNSKCSRSVTQEISAVSERGKIINEANLSIDSHGLAVNMKNVIEDSHSSRFPSNNSTDDISSNLKHYSLDAKPKQINDNQQIISVPTNIQTKEKDTPKISESKVFLSPKIVGSNQGEKINFRNVCKSAENSYRSMVANSRTNKRDLSVENNTSISSPLKNASCIISKIPKIKYRLNTITDNEKPIEKCQTNTSVLSQSKEMYESGHKNKELGILSLKFNDSNDSIKNSSCEESSNIASTERKQSIIPSVETITQNTISYKKQKRRKVSGMHNISESGNLKNLCNKSNNSKAVKCKSGVTEGKLNKDLNEHSKSNSVWRMINLDSPNTNNCLPETSSSDRVYKVSERYRNGLERKSVKKSLVLKKYNDEDEFALVKSKNKMYNPNSETVDRKYVPVIDSSSGFKMKFVKVPVEKSMVERISLASGATKQKQFVDNIDSKKYIIKLENEELHNKVKKSKDSSFKHDNEKNKEQINLMSPPHDANIETSIRSEEKKKKLSHVKKYDKCHTGVQTESIENGKMLCKSLTTTGKEILRNKLSDLSEEVNTIEVPSVQAHKKLSRSSSDPNGNSCEMEYGIDSTNNGLENFEKTENHVSYDTKTNRKRKHSINSPKKDHCSNNKNNVSNSKEAIPVLNLMKLPNNQWSDKAKLDLDPYVKLKKLTEQEILAFTNHSIKTPVLDLHSHNSDNNKIEFVVPTPCEEINEEQTEDGVDVKRAKLSTTFIKFEHEWRIAEPAALTVEVESDVKSNKVAHSENTSNGNNDKVVPQNQLKNSGDLSQTNENLNKISGSTIECSDSVKTDSSQNMPNENVGSHNHLFNTKLKTHVIQNIVSEKHQFVSQNGKKLAQKVNVENNKCQNILKHVKNRCSLTQNRAVPTQLNEKSCSNKFISDLIDNKCEVNEQNSLHKHISDSYLPNSEVNHCTPERQQPIKKVVSLKQYNSHQTSVSQNTVIPNQLNEKSSSKKSMSDLLVKKCEVNKQNSVLKCSSDLSLPNSEMNSCISEIQQPIKKVVLVRQCNSNQTSISSSVALPEYMSQVSCQPSTFSHNTYSDSLQTGENADTAHCQKINEMDSCLDANTIVHSSKDNFVRYSNERQNNKISVATTSASDNTSSLHEFEMNSCNVSENTISPSNRNALNNCSKSTSSQQNKFDAQARLHTWTISNPAVSETPLDYTVTQSQSVDSWNMLDSRSKNSDDDIQGSTNEIQDLSQLQQISTDIKTYSEYVDGKLNEEKLNIHLQTSTSDQNLCSSQMKYKENLSLDTATLPYPPQIPDDSDHSVIRCCCQQCCKNYHILINNYNKLIHYRSSEIEKAADKKPREIGEMLAKSENEPDSSLPLKKRKTLTQSTTEDKIESYPNTPMISIAELELANYSHSKRLIQNPSVPLYSRLGTEPVPSQYVAQTNDWNFQNHPEDQNHLAVTTPEHNNLGGHNLINIVAQNNVSQYIVNGQEETAKVKRGLKRQKQSLR